VELPRGEGRPRPRARRQSRSGSGARRGPLQGLSRCRWVDVARDQEGRQDDAQRVDALKVVRETPHALHITPKKKIKEREKKKKGVKQEDGSQPS